MGGMSDKKGGPKYYVVDYYMSVHYGICHGPVDALLGIWIKERDAWPATRTYTDGDDDEENDDSEADSEFVINYKEFVQSLDTNGLPSTNRVGVAIEPGGLNINVPNLFGGDKKEGGSVGTAHFLPGRSDQVMPEHLAAKLGLTSATCPGFRGLTSLFFHADSRGFMWNQNNPYFPGAWVTVYRASRCDLPVATMVIQTGDEPPSSNPAHIIYECLTNTAWGMGASPSMIDIEAFTAVAQTLYDEKFGLSLQWVKQGTIEEFIKEILDHIMGYYFLNPSTGKMTLTLARKDYDEDLLPVLDLDNSDILSSQRKALGETVNEVVITWTNPENEQEETITFQDLANITMQGGVVSEGRNYYGARNVELASLIGARDIRSASAPLYSAEVETMRDDKSLMPGKVVILSNPEDGIERIVMRISKVDYGRPSDLTIKLSLIEDIFALDTAEYIEPPKTGWTDSGTIAQPMAYSRFVTTPLPPLIASGAESNTVDDYYPRASVMVLAQQIGADSNSFNLWSDVVTPIGTIDRQNIATMLETARSVTLLPIAKEVESTLTPTTLGSVDGWFDYEVGDTLMFGSSDEATSEITMLKSYNRATKTMVLLRGIYDTIPRAWPVGTEVWYIPDAFGAVDLRESVAGGELTYQIQPQTTRGILPIADAPEITFTPTDRVYRPFRPANVKLDGQSFVNVVYNAVWPTVVPVSWSNRNRLTEDQVAMKWDDASAQIEPGQTTTIRLRKTRGGLINEITGIVGTSYDVPIAMFAGREFVVVEVISVRNGFESLQFNKQTVRFVGGIGDGYGDAYGEDYGALIS